MQSFDRDSWFRHPLLTNIDEPLKETPRRPALFISHNTADKPFARELAEDLNRFGIDGWLDEWEVGVGESLHGSIGAALQYSRYVGILISPEFTQSEWCLSELHEALAREKREHVTVVLPLLLRDAPMPPFVQDRLFLSFRESYYPPLFQLCAMLHGFSTRQVSLILASETPSSARDVQRSLCGLGWDNYSLVDRPRFEQLRAALQAVGVSTPPDKFLLDGTLITKSGINWNSPEGQLIRDFLTWPQRRPAGRVPRGTSKGGSELLSQDVRKGTRKPSK